MLTIGLAVMKGLRLVGTAFFILSLLLSSTAAHAAAIPGQIIVDPEHPMWLKYSGAGPFFLAGPGDPEDFLYRGTRSPDGTRIGDQMALITKLKDTGANSIYFQAIRSHGGDGDPTHNPFVDPSNSSSEINLAILDQWETWFTEMDNNGIVIFFFFYDDAIRVSANASLGWPLDSLGNLHVRERNYIETLVNRFKHHKNLIWVVMEEVQEMGGDYVAHAKKIAQVISQADDQDHVIAVHKLNGLSFSEFADDPNIDQFAIQDNSGTSAPALHNDMVTAWNNASGRYNLNMSESLNQPGKTGDALRKENWAIAMGGAYVMVLGMDIQNTDLNDLHDLGRLRSFMESTNFNTMAPHDELAFGGTEYVLGNPGSSYIAYASFLTGDIGLKGMTPGAYDFNWYDVTNGNIVVQTNVNLPAGDQTWSTPFGIGNELAVFIERTIVNTTAPVIANDSASTAIETAVTISVLANDIDVEGDALTVTNLTQPANGSVALNPDNTVTYTPDTGFSGTDTFTYTANDGQLGSNIASVIVTIDP